MPNGANIYYKYSLIRNNIPVTRLVTDSVNDPTHVGKYAFNFLKPTENNADGSDVYIIPGCRYTFTLPDGGVTEPITAAKNVDYDKSVISMKDYYHGSLSSSGIEIVFPMVPIDRAGSDLCVYSETEIPSYDLKIEYVDGGENDNLEWEEVISIDDLSTIWEDPYTYHNSEYFYANKERLFQAFSDNPNSVVKVELGDCIYYAYCKYAITYGNSRTIYIGNYERYPDPLCFFLSDELTLDFADTRWSYITTRDKITNVPLKIYKQVINDTP